MSLAVLAFTLGFEVGLFILASTGSLRRRGGRNYWRHAA